MKKTHSLNAHITDTPLYEGNIQSQLKISFQARSRVLLNLAKTAQARAKSHKRTKK